MTVLDYLLNESVLNIGINEKLKIKNEIIKENPNLLKITDNILLYKLYYLNLFLKDIKYNLLNKEDNEDYLYKQVPITFEFYKDPLDYIETVFSELKDDINIIKNIIEKLIDVNKYIAKMINEQKGSLKYINIMMRIIKNEIKENQTVIDEFISFFDVKFPTPEIKIKSQYNITFNNENFIDDLNVIETDKNIYPVFRADFAIGEKFFPISINEIILNDLYNEETDYSFMLKYYLFFLIDEEKENNNIIDNKNEINEIISFLVKKIKESIKNQNENNKTKQFFIILNNYKDILEKFFLLNSNSFSEEEIIKIYEKVLIEINSFFFADIIENITI